MLYNKYHPQRISIIQSIRLTEATLSGGTILHLNRTVTHLLSKFSVARCLNACSINWCAYAPVIHFSISMSSIFFSFLLFSFAQHLLLSIQYFGAWCTVRCAWKLCGCVCVCVSDYISLCYILLVCLLLVSCNPVIKKNTFS